MKKLFILLIVMISLLLVCFFTRGFAESELERIVNKDTYGAFSKENMEKMTNVILAKDETAFKMLIIEGKIFPVKKGTRVFIEDTAFWSGCAKVRPEGQTEDIWLFFEDFTEVESATNEPQRSTITKESNPYKIEGIFYDKVKPAVMIGGKIHFVNDSVYGGKIITISPEKVKIKFQDIEKEYKPGELITGAGNKPEEQEHYPISTTKKRDLPLDVRKKIFYEACGADKRLIIEVERKYPHNSTDIKEIRENAKNRNEMRESLMKNYRKALCDKYNISEEEEIKIEVEGAENHWPQPPWESPRVKLELKKESIKTKLKS